MTWRRSFGMGCWLAVLAISLAAMPAGAQTESAPAAAQTPQPTTTSDGHPPADEDAQDEVLDPDEIPPESTPDPSDTEDCDPDRPADGDESYCVPCEDVEAPDADYTDYAYCLAGAGGGGGDDDRPEERPRPEPVRAIPTGTLPLTGGDPLEPALLGMGLVLLGAGLRLRLRLSPAGRRPSP